MGEAAEIAHKAIVGQMSLSRAVLATIALVVIVQGKSFEDETPEVMFTQQGFSYEETGADVYSEYDSSLKGQSGLAKKLSAAHDAEIEERRKSDGLGGGSVLSSVGIQGGAKAPEDPTSDDFGELALVQVMGDDDSWMPSGQKGLSDKIDAAKNEAQKKKLKSDGLKGNDVLASAGMADEEPVSPNDDPTDIGDLNLVQLAAKFDAKGQKDLQKSPTQAAQEEEKKEIMGDEEAPKIKGDPAQESIFGAVDIKIVKKEDEEDDELQKLGIIDTSDIKFNGPKGWLSEDDIKLLQIQH